jgi:hypothetical protein
MVIGLFWGFMDKDLTFSTLIILRLSGSKCIAEYLLFHEMTSQKRIYWISPEKWHDGDKRCILIARIY